MAAITVGVSLKAYFGRQQARDWFDEVAFRVGTHPAVRSGAVEVFVAPTYLQIADAVAAFAPTRIRIGAQDVSTFAAGAFTGETSASELSASGVTLVEIGHAERRRLRGETDADVAAKAAAALAHGLTPLVCVGETDPQDPDAAASATLDQLRADLAGAAAAPVLVAYEPVWAIGAPEPAPIDHIRVVTRALRAELEADPARRGSGVIYGGSAGPGLLTRLSLDVDGVFLGRFAHDPAAFTAVIDEAAALAMGSAS